ncbi:MAG: SDR family oxidoreductase [bacterium]
MAHQVYYQEEEKLPPQHQDRQPGIQSIMIPQPKEKGTWYHGSDKLLDKVALITGGDSGIGRAVALFFAREGAHVAITYYDEHEDAEKAQQMVQEEGRRCLLIAGDIRDDAFCRSAVQRTVNELNHLDILVNNAAFQTYQENLESVTNEQIERIFRTNIFSYFYMARAAIRHMKPGSAIINTTSVTAYRGSTHFLDYSSTKGAIVSFTRSLALSLVNKGIRVNGVAPGPIWTPLIPSSFPAEAVPQFGTDVPMGRAGHPEDVAPCYVFLASRDSSYMTGQILHPNGGEIING